MKCDFYSLVVLSHYKNEINGLNFLGEKMNIKKMNIWFVLGHWTMNGPNSLETKLGGLDLKKWEVRFFD